MDKRAHRIQIFEDTERIIRENYHDDVQESIYYGKVYTECSDILKHISTRERSTKYIVNKSRSFEAAEDYLDSQSENKLVAVLNFASAKNPGGGVANGSSAQEESLCRVSSLYNVISNQKFYKDFYGYHKTKKGTLYTDRLIYAPCITIVKDDDGNDMINPYYVDVITCAAPNLNPNCNVSYNGDRGSSQISDEELFKIHYSRCLHIIRAAANNGIDCLVLGAFGCGVFRNNPTVVAKAMKKALEDSPYKFEAVIFPIYCNDWETENYDAFKRVFRDAFKKVI